MQRLPSDVLTDPGYRVPEVAAGAEGMVWLRSHVVRFCEDDEHERRRELVATVLDEVADAPFVGTPTRSLLAALGLSADLADDVALASAAYQPHAPQSVEADAAADRLVSACGGRTDESAARVCVLVQADVACRALTETIRAGSDDAPLAATRRVAPDGGTVEVSLDGAHFGLGTHRCPGETLAVRLCEEQVRATS